MTCSHRPDEPNPCADCEARRHGGVPPVRKDPQQQALLARLNVISVLAANGDVPHAVTIGAQILRELETSRQGMDYHHPAVQPIVRAERHVASVLIGILTAYGDPEHVA